MESEETACRAVVTTFREPAGAGVWLVVTYDPGSGYFMIDGVSTDDKTTHGVSDNDGH